MAAYGADYSHILYAKVPKERLIAGFLHVLVRHKRNTSNGFDDVVQEYSDNWANIDAPRKEALPWNNFVPLNGAGNDPGRGGMNLTFGDFDCFLFYVTGGMALQSVSATGSHTGIQLDGYEYTTGTWYETITHKCQSFVRHDLISRANNSYGHDNNSFWKTGKTRYRYTGDGNDIVGGTVGETILNTGEFSSSHVTKDNPKSLDTFSNNTFFTPVSSIEVFGSHTFSENSNEYRGPGGTDDGTLIQVNTHETSYWNLNVSIMLRGYDDTEGTSTVADTVFAPVRVNCFFQPFGETPSMEFSTTEYTT